MVIHHIILKQWVAKTEKLNFSSTQAQSEGR